MSRNKNRLQIPDVPKSAPPEPDNAMGYSIPTELVDLPSEGRFYPSGHPLHNEKHVEIRYMTAKDEDILTSPSFLSKGVAIDKFISNILVNKNIDQDSLLDADRNAIMIAARTTGYGKYYETSFDCQHCGARSDVNVDLTSFGVRKTNELALEELGVQIKDGICSFQTELLEADFEIKLSSYGDAKNLVQTNDNKVRLGLEESQTTDFLKSIIISVNGAEDRDIINRVVDLMPALDARKIKKVHKLAVPEVDTEVELICSKCGQASRMEVPFTAGFFWPEL